jgi:hypothetical protein
MPLVRRELNFLTITATDSPAIHQKLRKQQVRRAGSCLRMYHLAPESTRKAKDRESAGAPGKEKLAVRACAFPETPLR